MASQNLQYRGWCPSNDYQVHEVTGPALRKRSDRPRPQKKHVVFKTILEEEPVAAAAAAEEEAPLVPVAETTTVSRTERVNYASESVDQKADAFIKLGHRRFEIA